MRDAVGVAVAVAAAVVAGETGVMFAGAAEAVLWTDAAEFEDGVAAATVALSRCEGDEGACETPECGDVTASDAAAVVAVTVAVVAALGSGKGTAEDAANFLRKLVNTVRVPESTADVLLSIAWMSETDRLRMCKRRRVTATLMSSSGSESSASLLTTRRTAATMRSKRLSDDCSCEFVASLALGSLLDTAFRSAARTLSSRLSEMSSSCDPCGC